MKRPFGNVWIILFQEPGNRLNKRYRLTNIWIPNIKKRRWLWDHLIIMLIPYLERRSWYWGRALVTTTINLSIPDIGCIFHGPECTLLPLGFQCSRSCGGTGFTTRLLSCVWQQSGGPAGPQCEGLQRPFVFKACTAPPCNEIGQSGKGYTKRQYAQDNETLS